MKVNEGGLQCSSLEESETTTVRYASAQQSDLLCAEADSDGYYSLPDDDDNDGEQVHVTRLNSAVIRAARAESAAPPTLSLENRARLRC